MPCPIWFKSFLPGSEIKLHLIGECNQPDWRRHHSDHQNTQIKGQNVVWAVLGFQPPSSVFATHLLTMVLTIWRPLSKPPATDQADFSPIFCGFWAAAFSRSADLCSCCLISRRGETVWAQSWQTNEHVNTKIVGLGWIKGQKLPYLLIISRYYMTRYGIA